MKPAQAIRARERFAEMLQGVVLLAEQGLHARDVVERERVARVAVQDPAADLESRRVVLGVVRLEEVAHRLARGDRERLPGGSADRDDDRVVVLRHGAPAHGGVADEDRGAVRSVDLLAGDREHRVAGDDEVQLLVLVRARADLVVLADRARPCGRANGIGSERSDAQLRPEPDALALPALLGVRGLGDRENREAGLRRSRHQRPSQAGRATVCRSRGLVFRRNAPRRRGRSRASARRRSVRSTERSLCTSRSG
jgi:hypothetical protein